MKEYFLTYKYEGKTYREFVWANDGEDAWMSVYNECDCLAQLLSIHRL